MKKHLITVSMGAWLLCSPVVAQPDPAAVAIEAYSKCLRAAVASEKARPNPSLGRIKSVCIAEYKVLAQALPSEVLQEITDLIDEGLRRELRQKSR